MLNRKEFELLNKELEANEIKKILSSWNGEVTSLAVEISKIGGEKLSLIKAGKFYNFGGKTCSFCCPTWEEYLDWKKLEQEDDFDERVVRYTLIVDDYIKLGNTELHDYARHSIFVKKEDLK